MAAKEWRRRINKATEAKTAGDLGPLVKLCEEIAGMETQLAALKQPLPLPMAKPAETFTTEWRDPHADEPAKKTKAKKHE